MATTKTTNKQTAIITARKRNSKSNFWHTFGKHFSYNRKFPKKSNQQKFKIPFFGSYNFDGYKGKIPKIKTETTKKNKL